jgi:hypothetical protein
VPPEALLEGHAELVGVLVMTCTGMGPSQSALVNIHIFLNVNVTSRITTVATSETEALLLIDEPKPGIPNTSNGFPYFGQVLGTPGVHAGNPGSGNVYQGTLAAANSIVFEGVPFVTGGTRTFRINNVRANANMLGVPGPINFFVSMVAPFSAVITPATGTIAFATTGLQFKAFPAASSPTALELTFHELFATAFKKRIENTNIGPLTAIHQDVPGDNYCTESGFTPEFSPVTPGAIGSAVTGTRLLAHVSNIPPAVSVLIVPNQVVSSSGTLIAHRVTPPFAADFTGGTVSLAAGTSTIPVPLHEADLLYEVTGAPPFFGKNGCLTLDTFTGFASSSPAFSLANAIVHGSLAPRDPTPVASPTAPEPRFVP